MIDTFFLSSLRALASPVQGMEILLYGLSGRGFPGGDGAAEAVEMLPLAGVSITYTHALDPELSAKLDRRYDVAIIANTRIGDLVKSDRRLWNCAARRVLWFWDLRPGDVGAPLRGLIDHVFLSYSGSWISPQGVAFAPAQWGEALRCPVGYCPQASPTRTSVEAPGAPRILFVGDLANKTYHQGRGELCRALDVTVLNARDRAGRLSIEAMLPRIYRSARYVLSMSPLAPGYTSVRTYSILACGGLMLLHKFPGWDRLFRDGEHAVAFGSIEELQERLALLDEDPASRERIAAAGRLLHATKHTVAHRVLSMCREVAGAADGFSGWL